MVFAKLQSFYATRHSSRMVAVGGVVVGGRSKDTGMVTVVLANVNGGNGSGDGDGNVNCSGI